MFTRLFLFAGLALLVVNGTVVLPSEDICADCGDTMKDFRSLCEMEDYNDGKGRKCVFQHYGKCGTFPGCEPLFQPKCAWNGQTFRNFSNACALKKFNEQYYDRYVVVTNCLCNSDANEDGFGYPKENCD